MKRNCVSSIVLGALLLFLTRAGLSEESMELKIDPLLLVSLKECRNIMKSLGEEIFPGWGFQKTPVLFYRPRVQELLINFPHQPKGFSRYTGFNPLGSEAIYVRNDSTLFSLDDQNTSHEIEGIRVLVVADPFSTMRSQLQDVLTNRPKEWAAKWLKDWNFIPSPYQVLQIILHEAFHVYQNKMAPDKSANEMVVSQYPLLDPVNNALYVLEGNILKDALLTKDQKVNLEKIKEFVAVRSFRQSRLDSSWVEYENLNEYNEGLAKYVEYKFLKLAESLKPVPEMSYHYGFNGYQGVVAKQFQDRMKNMVDIVAVSDDRFGNRFGSGPLRFKLYELGACQALLLDQVSPSWKERTFQDGVYLGDLLKQAVAMSPDELELYLKQAQSAYNYAEAYRSKVEFEQEGKKKIEEKLKSILNTDQTLVKILYGGLVEKLGGIGYTPFGVTQVTEKSAIYDMVPIQVLFRKGVELQMKEVIPVLIDREKMMIAFTVSTPIAMLGTGSKNRLETDEFTLSGSRMDLEREGNAIVVKLR